MSRATSSSSSGVGVSAGRGRGKRLRLETEDAQGPRGSGPRLAQQTAVPGVVSIEEVDLEGRFVRLKNASDKDQSLGSWRIRRQGPEGEDIAYKFTPKYVLRAGQTVTVWAAGAGAVHSPPSTLVWKSQTSWGSGESCRTVLVNADGEEVAVQAVKQSSVQVSENGEDEEEEAEEEAEFGEEDLFHQQGDPRTTSRGCRLM